MSAPVHAGEGSAPAPAAEVVQEKPTEAAPAANAPVAEKKAGRFDKTFVRPTLLPLRGARRARTDAFARSHRPPLPASPTRSVSCATFLDSQEEERETKHALVDMSTIELKAEDLYDKVRPLSSCEPHPPLEPRTDDSAALLSLVPFPLDPPIPPAIVHSYACRTRSTLSRSSSRTCGLSSSESLDFRPFSPPPPRPPPRPPALVRPRVRRSTSRVQGERTARRVGADGRACACARRPLAAKHGPRTPCLTPPPHFSLDIRGRTAASRARAR